MNGANTRRWDALDVLRGLTIMLMLLNIAPGSWAHNYGFLVHAPWESWTLIDMVAPAFLFCIGVAMPLSFERCSARGDSRGHLMLLTAQRMGNGALALRFTTEICCEIPGRPGSSNG